MRLPAVAIAAVFAGGAVLGQTQWFAQCPSSHIFLSIGFVAMTMSRDNRKSGLSADAATK
jgi:hypothetical protein